MSAQADDRSVNAPGRCRRTSRESMRAWYAGGLRSRLAQAVAAGRVDAVKAADLHRLMTQLLERDLPHRTVVTAVARAGRRSST